MGFIKQLKHHFLLLPLYSIKNMSTLCPKEYFLKKSRILSPHMFVDWHKVILHSDQGRSHRSNRNQDMKVYFCPNHHQWQGCAVVLTFATWPNKLTYNSSPMHRREGAYKSWLVHTSYLSREPRVYPCKNFLAGVNFYRFNAKNWQFTV